MAMSNDVPAPKKPPTCPITFDAAATNNATPSAPKLKTRIEDRGLKIEDRLARNDAILDPRSSILDPRSSILDRSGQQASRRRPPQRPQRPPDADERGHDSRQRPDQQRLRCDAQFDQRRADCTDPPCAQSEHHQRPVSDRADQPDAAAERRERQAFAQKQRADLFDRKPDGAQQPDLAQPLLDAEPEKKRRQQQRRDDQEKAEVGEVFAEISRAARGLQALFFDRLNRQPHSNRVERGAQLFFKRVTRSM